MNAGVNEMEAVLPQKQTYRSEQLQPFARVSGGRLFALDEKRERVI